MINRLTYCYAKKFLVSISLGLLIILPFAVLLFFNAGRTTVQGLEVGVDKGDWIEYNLERTPSSGKFITRIRRTILDVDGSNITVERVQWYSDETTTNETLEGNIADGSGAAALVFIPSDSKPGDIIHVQGLDPIRINGTDKRTYLNTERTVLWANFSGMGMDVLVFWDSEKGVALEIYSNTPQLVLITTVVDTNLWVHGSQSDNNYLGLITLASILIILLIASAVKYASSRKKPS